MVNFRTVTTIVFEEIGKSRINSVNLRIKCSKYGKKSTKFTNQKKKKKKHWYRGIYVCNLIKLQKNMLSKGDFRRGSRVQGPMNSSNLIGQKL